MPGKRLGGVKRMPAYTVLLAPDLFLPVLQGVPPLSEFIVLPAAQLWFSIMLRPKY